MEKKADNILDQIISLTFARHQGLSTEDYLKALGKDSNANEEQEIRSAKMTMLCTCTKELIKAISNVQMVTKTLEAINK